ncbi:MAG: dihydropteroate synthase, partial [Planctomycetota bacterium]
AIEEGAHVIDVGGESTRPGSERVPTDEQLARVIPVIRAIRETGLDTPITIDTTRVAVARAALDAGADAINDVSGATEEPAMLRLAAERGCGIVLMHRMTTPTRDVYSTQYEREPDYAGDVVASVRAALQDLLARALDLGVREEAILLDPGLGFGKSVEQNLELIRETHRLCELGRPVLSGASRKSFVGAISGVEDPAMRDEASAIVSVLHRQAGAGVFRVHAVGPHARALRIAGAVGSTAVE